MSHCISGKTSADTYLSVYVGQAQLLAIAQSIPSALLVFVACAIPVGAYGVLREDLSSGLFSAAAFILLSLELTMVSCPSVDIPCA